MKIAFIGLGAMGFPMARHLAKEHDVLVWNRTRERADRLAKAVRARVARTPTEAAREADVVITCLPTSRGGSTGWVTRSPTRSTRWP